MGSNKNKHYRDLKHLSFRDLPGADRDVINDKNRHNGNKGAHRVNPSNELYNYFHDGRDFNRDNELKFRR